MKVGTDGVLLGAVATHDLVHTILDIGTGSGLIAMMLAQKYPTSVVHGIDISTEAAELAHKNFSACPFSARLQVFHSGITELAEANHHRYDLIVSNPPFFTGGNFSPDEQKNVMRQTFKLSHQDLLRSVHKLLNPGGSFWVILPHLEGLRFIEMAMFYGLNQQTIVKVHSRPSKPIERLILQFARNKGAVTESTLFIHEDQENSYSSDYIALTKDYYPFLED